MRFSLALLRFRAPVAGAALALGALGHGTAAPPPARTVEGLARLLAETARVEVSPDAIWWEPDSHPLLELAWGRRVLFLGAPAAGRPRDVYRARVRLGFDGQPLGASGIRNLTETPLGDDTALQAAGPRAVFATLAFGKIQGITALDTEGIREDDLPEGWAQRALLGVTSLQHTGSFAGIGATNLVFDVAADVARLRIDERSLHVDLGAARPGLTLDLETRALRGADGGEPYAVRAEPERHTPKPFVLWAVDTVRASVGPELIAWLERTAFGARDTVKRTAYGIFATRRETAEGAPPRVLRGEGATEGDRAWPPPKVPSIWRDPEPTEGEWKPVEISWLRAPEDRPSAEPRPPAFYRTKIRPDRERPYSEVLLVALDMRQLELGVQAGTEDPKPLTGPPGDGRLPRDPKIVHRVAATFNGAFKTLHGAYGMMVDRRVLVPPGPGAATVVITDSGEVGFGDWPADTKLPPGIRSFRQNLDPLVASGVENPRGRSVWGDQLLGESVLTERTALCTTSAGHVFYAWGREVSGPSLAKALVQAGCVYAVHLDMNPKHCGFVFSRVEDVDRHEARVELADADMTLNPYRFVYGSQKDFFYALYRDPIPSGDASWSPSAGVQPPPAWAPGIFETEKAVGGLRIRILDVEPGRVEWRVRSGSEEPLVAGARAHKRDSADDEANRTIAAIGLGHTTSATRYGLVFDGRASLELRRSYATLVLGPAGLTLHSPGEIPSVSDAESAVQLPLVAEDGEVLEEATERGAMRERGALCVVGRGRVLIALGRHDSTDALASALLDLGCKRVAELDRGSRHPVFVHRAGTDLPPLRSYETSVLYALARPMQPGAFLWKP